jgi:hypothetical protein
MTKFHSLSLSHSLAASGSQLQNNNTTSTPLPHMKKAPAFFLLPFVCGLSDQWITVQRQPLNTQGRHLIIISPPANFLQPSYSGLPPPTAYLPASYRGSLFGLLYEGQRRRELPATKKDNPIR